MVSSREPFNFFQFVGFHCATDSFHMQLKQICTRRKLVGGYYLCLYEWSPIYAYLWNEHAFQKRID